MPDHLSCGLAFHAADPAGVSVAPTLALAKGTEAEGPPDPRRDIPRFDGVTPDGRWAPEGFFLASCWFLRREAAEAVGPWIPAGERGSRPRRNGCTGRRRAVGIGVRPRITVLCLHAGARRGTYVARRSPGQERAAAWVAGGEAVRATLFELAALQHAREQAAARRRRIGRRLVSALAPFGLHPDAVRRWIARMGKGRWVAEGHARGRAVPEPPVGRRIPAGDPALSGGFGAGWHGPEPEGRWSAAGEAELLLRSPAPGLVLVLGLRSLAP
ncbi:MAG: hypothetical protein NZM27_01780 [Acetobacteraceae bacterium]|nr:hypothetical protein [Acetobacteraceae bacterium]